jgi:hypothetical protein
MGKKTNAWEIPEEKSLLGRTRHRWIILKTCLKKGVLD